MKRLVGFSSLLAALLAGPAFAQTSPQTAANVWLGEVDLADYGKAYSDADPVIQGAVTPTTFAGQVAGVRTPLGELRSRELTESKAASTLPGAPDGAYEVLTYTSSFANKGAAVETVVMRQESDGWKPSGYYLR